jgi:large subunit ribosomal protein L35Ae
MRLIETNLKIIYIFLKVFVVSTIAEAIEGIVVNYRVGPKTQKAKECIIQFKHVASASEAGRLIGRKVTWKIKESKIIGKVIALHGRKGLVRVRFKKGLPGQALGTTVELVG